MMIRVAPGLFLDDAAFEESFVQAPGPGGQNVNKVATAVQLRFDVRGCPTLPEAVKARLARLAGRRLTKEGVLVLMAHRHRTRERNRADAAERLLALVRAAAVAPVRRKPTRPSAGQRRQRLEAKVLRGGVKALRRTPQPE
ncbi:MAG TPA: alternative ribosome rescue aminoacyl-tRNA hydrolase ArfB [Acetobacteraceae bacterium]|nr:alternative ribosome rescue aminoacyl-tRNA hydrolase ArfB [Acetobacteraceae bacterium]